ncbi:MAG: glutamate--tRNA ligase, partial [Rickettsiella sp.]|nr:glutamate--tRNA ligase [Rickettsiella sp.]
PGKEGEQGPYFQSQRQAIYDYYYEKLERLGRAYPCFCSEQELAIMRKLQLSQGKPPRYSGTCRHLSDEKIAKKRAGGEKSALRFQVLSDQTIQFFDLVKGEQAFSSDDIGDFVIRRSDGSAAFFFCNAIDDALMKVTHVLRGEDHLTNTPRQMMLLESLDLPIPAYGHMSLIIGDDGMPLSKRHGSFSIKALQELGYFPEALQNYLARLGHVYTNPDFMELAALSKHFSIERLGKSPARFDNVQLLYWQKQALLKCSDDQLQIWLGEEVKTCIPSAFMPKFIELIRSNVSFPDEALAWAKTLFAELCLTVEAKVFLKKVTPLFWKTALRLTEKEIDFKRLIKKLQDELNIKGKALFVPLRIALTGRFDGPELEKLYKLIGSEKIRKRLLYAKNL